jgi:subtilisin family serine protease
MPVLLRRPIAAALACGAIAALFAGSAAGDAPRPVAATAPPSTGTVASPGVVLVRLTVAAHATAGFKSDLGARGRTGLPGLDQALDAIGAVQVEPLLRFAAKTASEPGRALNRSLIVRYDGGEEPAAAVARLAAVAEVELASPDGPLFATDAPDDPFYPDQWAHDNHGQAVAFDSTLVGTPDADTDTDLAWELTTGSSSVVIAIIDSGVDLGHPEFAGRVLAGYDFVNNDNDPRDDYGHGTCCAGVALARGDNAAGIAGVAWQSLLMPLKVLNEYGHSTSIVGLANAVVWAADHGADIISLSLGGYNPVQAEEDALAYAYGLGCAIFCAAGNYDDARLIYPAAYINYTIPVGALSPCNDRKTPTTCDGEDYWGSNHTTNCTFTPGVRIATTDIRGGGGYTRNDYTMEFNGTSASTPHAAGVGALVLALNPGLGPYQLEQKIILSSEDLGAQGVDADTGWGRLNAHLAVLGAFTLPTYARAGYVGAEAGTLHQPWDSFANGINFVPSGGNLVLSGGLYDLTGPVTVTKPMTIRGINGVAVIRP